MISTLSAFRAAVASGLVPTPARCLGVELGEVGERPAGEEVTLHEPDEPLDLPLRVRVPRQQQPHLEPDARHDRGVLGIPDGPTAGVAPVDHAGHVLPLL